MKKFYLIKNVYYGSDLIHPDVVMEISAVPGRTNMSGEVCTDGWLGSCGDISFEACGQFYSLDEARAAAAENGYTEEYDDCGCCDESIVERLITPEQDAEWWDADQWLHGIGNHETTCDEYGITPDSDIVDLLLAAEKIEDEAAADGIKLDNLLECLTCLRDELIEETINL